MLSDVDIVKELGKNILIYPFDEKNLKGASFNLTASELAWSITSKETIASGGKIMHYCYYTKAKQFNVEITSDTLSYIQVEEAFKKQMFLSLSWSITKLNYFYDYGSQNENELNTNESEDILFNSKAKLKFISKLFKEYTECKSDKFNELYAKIKTSFPIEESDSICDIISLLFYIEQSISHFRNNCFHYNINSIFELLTDNCYIENLENTIKNLENKANKLEDAFELKNALDNFKELYEKKSDENTHNIVKKLFIRDINSIQVHFKEQIRSTNIAEYYSFDLLKNIFSSNSIKFKLYAPHYAMMPSFNKIHKRGCNISKSTRLDKRITWMIELDTEIENEGKIAYKNLLQLIYYHSFLPEVYNDGGDKLVSPFINKTIEWNKAGSISEQKGKCNDNKYRYADMPEFLPSMTLSQYLQDLQRQQLIKENDGIVSDKGNYYLDFIQDIFLLAFDNFLNEKLNSFDTLKYPKKICDSFVKDTSATTIDALFDENKPILNMKTEITLDSNFIGMYPFLRTLDQRELNNLLHQFIRYRTSCKTRITKDDADVLERVEELITLVQFTIPIQTADKHYKIAIDKYFKYFFEGEQPQNFGEMYYQCDKETLIPHRSMSLIGRSGAMALYKDMFSSIYQITQSEFFEYNNLCNKDNFQDDSVPTKIEEMQKELQQLHKDLVLIKPRSYYDKVAKKEIFIPLSKENQEKFDAYKKLLEEIKKYEALRHKLTFESLYKVHQMHVDILGRFAAFAEDWERDMFFMLTALKSLGLIDFNVNANFEKGCVVSNLCNNLKQDSGKLFFELCWSNEDYEKNKSNIQRRLFSRNSVAHLNHMTQLKVNNKIPQRSIIELINSMRVLLSYDIKRQNSVTKSLQDILRKQYKIELKLMRSKTDPDKFELESIKSCEISHLNNLKDKVNINANNEFMIDLIEQLLTFKYPGANVK